MDPDQDCSLLKLGTPSVSQQSLSRQYSWLYAFLLALGSLTLRKAAQLLPGLARVGCPKLYECLGSSEVTFRVVGALGLIIT
jgi:hypothetical protein